MAITGDWDRRISRRRSLLKTGGSLAAGLTLAGISARRGSTPAAIRSRSASPPGTRARPASCCGRGWRRILLVVGGGLPAEPYEVRFEVSLDEDFHAIVRRGSTVAFPTRCIASASSLRPRAQA